MSLKFPFPNCDSWFRPPPTIGYFIIALSLPAMSAEYITDSDASAYLIAQSIAANSGGNPADYMVYARKLAKTLSYLTPDQQTNVFEPESAGSGSSSSGGSSPLGGSSGTGASTETGSSGDDGSSGSGDSGDGDDDWLSGFFDWLSGFFS